MNETELRVAFLKSEMEVRRPKSVIERSREEILTYIGDVLNIVTTIPDLRKAAGLDRISSTFTLIAAEHSVPSLFEDKK